MMNKKITKVVKQKEETVYIVEGTDEEFEDEASAKRWLEVEESERKIKEFQPSEYQQLWIDRTHDILIRTTRWKKHCSNWEIVHLCHQFFIDPNSFARFLITVYRSLSSSEPEVIFCSNIEQVKQIINKKINRSETFNVFDLESDAEGYSGMLQRLIITEIELFPWEVRS